MREMLYRNYERSMMYEITVTHLANEDLDSIVAYIAKTLANPIAATSLLDDISKCYDALSRTPLMYELCRNSRLKALHYRKAIIGNYVMVYKVDEKSKIVYILRFFYGPSDYENLI